MFHAEIPQLTCFSEEASVSSCSVVHHHESVNPSFSSFQSEQLKIKKKRSPPGNPDPEAEVIALSPRTLLATNRFVCEICNKGFQRDQNLQLHRRGHNLPWKLKQRNGKEIRKRAYVCPEPTCVHNNPSRALCDLTGIKKHYCRKHGEKKWKCEKCSKIYAVQSDWKAHAKTCGTREYRCDCGTLFSRKDSFITHRAFCEALAEESARLTAAQRQIVAATLGTAGFHDQQSAVVHSHSHFTEPPYAHVSLNATPLVSAVPDSVATLSSPYPQLSATALLHRAVAVGTAGVSHHPEGLNKNWQVEPVGDCAWRIVELGNVATWRKNCDTLTRDFLGLTTVDGQRRGIDGSGNDGGHMIVGVIENADAPYFGSSPNATDRGKC